MLTAGLFAHTYLKVLGMVFLKRLALAPDEASLSGARDEHLFTSCMPVQYQSYIFGYAA